MRLGIDFDNTLAGYDALFLALAGERGLLPCGARGGKKAVRDAVRRLPDGERHWMSLQAAAYGARMAEAEPLPGALDFLRACRARSIDFFIVSHKTRHAAADPGGTDLHQTSLAWMTARGFFEPDGIGLTPDRVFFEPTRADKCRRIHALGCSHFIDDLEEVFRDPAFPAGVAPLLLGLGHPHAPGPFTLFNDWRALHDALLPVR